MPVRPELVLRLGSHAEKEYFRKTARFLDGVIVGANLFEAAPGATASLIASPRQRGSNYYLDPMTYAFGTYVDPQTGRTRLDLDWIKSEQKVRGRPGKTIRDFKRSYGRLAQELGDPFEEALARGAAITASDFATASAIDRCADSVASYQLRRIAEELAKYGGYADFLGQIPPPAAIFAPYLYCEPPSAVRLAELNASLAAATSALGLPIPVHAILCADVSALADPSLLGKLRDGLIASNVKGVWLWFSKFAEDQASVDELRAFRGLVEALSDGRAVYNMHGGYFSLALMHVGMRGISHGVGYGEQKDVHPVIGQSTPTVRYYLPPIHRRVGVPQVQRGLHTLGINTPSEFNERVCSCAVCQRILAADLDEIQQFGELRYSTSTSKRLAQTPSAAKRCRYHFLLNRLKERVELPRESMPEIRRHLLSAKEEWGAEATLRNDVQHLGRWAEVLS